MLELLNTWQFNLIGYLITVVFFFQFYKTAVKDTKKDGAATILLQSFGAISSLLLVPFLPFVIATDPKVYLFLAIACVFYAVNDRLQTTARKHLEVSIFSILSQFLTVFLIIYGIVLFQESISAPKIIGATLILLGNVFLLYEKGKFSINKYTILSVLASMALATAISIDIAISKSFNLPFYMFLTFSIPSLFIALAERITPRTIISEYKKAEIKYYALAGFFWTLSIFFSLRSFQLGEVSLIVPLQATAVLLNVITASILLKERNNLDKKILAAAAVIIGVYITTLAL